MMTVEEFWNKAFLAALTRLSVEDAKKEADSATETCIKHWQHHVFHWAPEYLTRWQDQKISTIPKVPGATHQYISSHPSDE